MTLGLAPRPGGSLASTAAFCEGRVAPDSVYALLHRECSALSPDEMFADLFAVTGRPSAARAAGLAGRRRVLDSTPLYDAVATMDTVTLVRSAIRGPLTVSWPASCGGAGPRR